MGCFKQLQLYMVYPLALVRLLMNLWNSSLLMLAANVRYARSTAVSSTICLLIGYLRWKGYFFTWGIPSGEAA